MTKLAIVQVLLAQDVKKHCLEQDTYTNKHALKQRNNFSLKKNQWFKNALVSQVVLKTDLTILAHPEALLISAPLEVAISKRQLSILK